jgi:CHAD domain-containing protein
MSYVFDQREALDVTVRRVAREELEDAIGKLHGGEDDRDTRIHDVRKDLKKLRALLRLLRSELGAATYARENDGFRQLSHRLSGAREAAAIAATLQTLLASQHVSETRFSALREQLAERRRETHAQGLDDGTLHAIEHELRLALSRVSGWPLERPTWEAVAPGFRRAYTRGKRAMRRAYQEPSAENFHEWRKRVKDHLYHTRLLSSIWPEPLKGRRAALDTLAELLGDDHDLAELTRVVRESAGGDPAEREQLLALIEQRARELRERAYWLGARMYVEKPGALLARMHAYYQAWRSEAELPTSTPAESSNTSPGDR